MALKKKDALQMSNLLTAIRNAVAPRAQALPEEETLALNDGAAFEETPVAPSANAAVQAERERIKGILTCDAARQRQKIARQLAFDTDMSVEAASVALEAIPVDPEEGRAALSYSDRRILSAALDAPMRSSGLAQPDADQRPGGRETSSLVSNMKSRHGK